MATVYALCCRTTGKIYVGKTVNFTDRLGRHRRSISRHDRNDSYIARAIRCHGWDDFAVVVLANGVSEERAFQLEQAWIADLDLQNPANGYNLTGGGEGMTGHRPSAKTRQKLRASNLRRWSDPVQRAQLLVAVRLNAAKGAEAARKRM